MKLDITTPAILFPALSLLTLAYTNKFLALASIVRQLSIEIGNVKHDTDEHLILQINNLVARIHLLRHIQTYGLLSIFCCLISITFLYIEMGKWGDVFFILSIVFMMISIALAIKETMMSGKALEIQLKKIR